MFDASNIQLAMTEKKSGEDIKKFRREYLGADLAGLAHYRARAVRCLANRRELSGAVLPLEQNGHPVPGNFLDVRASKVIHRKNVIL